MSLMYQLLLQRSGLSAKAAAKLHKVTIGQVKDWTRFNARVPIAALNTLDLYCRGIDAAGIDATGNFGATNKKSRGRGPFGQP